MLGYRYWALLSLVFAGIFILSCNDSSNPSEPAFSFTGNWTVDQIHDPSWGWSPLPGNKFLIQINNSEAIEFEKIEIGGNCYRKYAFPVTYSGDKINSAGGSASITISRDPHNIGQIFLIVNSKTSSFLLDGDTLIATKYDGAMLPADWPKTVCGM